MRTPLIRLLALLLGSSALAQAPAVERTALDARSLAQLLGASVDAESVVLAAGETRTLHLEAPLGARSVGVWWEGEFARASLALEQETGAWGPLLDCVEDEHLAPQSTHAERPAGRRKVSGLHHAYQAPATSALLELQGPARLCALDLIWIGPGAPARREPPTALGADAYPKPTVWGRASWGAVAPQCGLSYCATTHLGVHHSASVSDGLAQTWSDCAGNVQSIQAYHMFTNGWCDVGYNMLACVTGDLFEGRAGGDDVVGAHDGHNCGSMGVCLMGYFHPPYNQTATNSALDALAELFAWKADQQGIDPQTASWYAGYGGSMSHVYGHKDVKNTACPGDQLYAQLPALRNAVDDLLQGGGPQAGTLKGVLYDQSQGTSARIAGGTVALGDGSFAITASDGYYEFALPSGTYALGATAPLFAAGASSETVTQGDVWESLGLWPTLAPRLSLSPLPGSNMLASLQADAGSSAWLLYALQPGLPLADYGAIGALWPLASNLQVIALGNVPGAGQLLVSLVPPAQPGLKFHLQAFAAWSGALRLSNGVAFETN